VARHDEENKPEVCAQCGKRFLLPSELRTHNFSHSNQFKYNCEHCKKGFSYPQILRQHLVSKHPKIHLAEKPFVCRDVCFMNFASEEEYFTHLKKHEENRKCKQCGRWFTTLQHLKDHVVSHTKEKHFKCHICKRCVARKDQLQVYIRQLKYYKCVYKY
jgi:KRAB domain-containing zinc finger protein